MTDLRVERLHKRANIGLHGIRDQHVTVDSTSFPLPSAAVINHRRQRLNRMRRYCVLQEGTALNFADSGFEAPAIAIWLVVSFSIGVSLPSRRCRRRRW